MADARSILRRYTSALAVAAQVRFATDWARNDVGDRLPVVASDAANFLGPARSSRPHFLSNGSNPT